MQISSNNWKPCDSDLPFSNGGLNGGYSGSYYADTLWIPQCTACEPGYYLSTNASYDYDMSTNQDEVITITPGLTSCTPCAAGKYSTNSAASNCSICAPNTRSASGASSCEPRPAGFFEIAVKAGGTGEDQAYALAYGENKLFVAGHFQDPATFASLSSLTSAGSIDAFVAAIDPSNGAYIWAVSAGGVDSDSARALAYGNDKLFVAGYFQSTTMSFTGLSSSLSRSGSDDIFLAAINPITVRMCGRSVQEALGKIRHLP